jgi:hypothetical protein
MRGVRSEYEGFAEDTFQVLRRVVDATSFEVHLRDDVAEELKTFL